MRAFLVLATPVIVGAVLGPLLCWAIMSLRPMGL